MISTQQCNQGSARISSLTLGNALVLIPSGAAINIGDDVDASLLDRSSRCMNENEE